LQLFFAAAVGWQNRAAIVCEKIRAQAHALNV